MRLTFEKIKEITKGAVRIEEQDGVINFYRFTKEQEELYGACHKELYGKTFATAGVRLKFKTNSRHLGLAGKIGTIFASSRKFYSFDVAVNGNYIGSLDNYDGAVLEGDYSCVNLPHGDFSKTFDLGDGEKTVDVYFPFSVKINLEEVTVDDGSLVEPTAPQGKMIAFGDSITHGYDALRSIGHYTHRLSNALNVELINKGIGAEVFWPELAALRDDIDPKYITVAYGTNDWSKTTRDEFKVNCRGFYKNLTENYPEAEIFAITPIWRGDHDTVKPFGDFGEVEKGIRELTKDLPNVTVISGYDLVPHDGRYYGDLRLHPSNEGFDRYFSNLYSKLKDMIVIDN